MGKQLVIHRLSPLQCSEFHMDQRCVERPIELIHVEHSGRWIIDHLCKVSAQSVAQTSAQSCTNCTKYCLDVSHCLGFIAEIVCTFLTVRRTGVILPRSAGRGVRGEPEREHISY